METYQKDNAYKLICLNLVIALAFKKGLYMCQWYKQNSISFTDC